MLSFLTVLALGCLINASSIYKIPSASSYFQENNIVPDLIPVGPPAFIKVTADKGTSLSPSQVRNTPTVKWEAEDDDLYTLLLVDVDAISNDDTSEQSTSEFLHWLIVNIPINDLCNGKHYAHYHAPAPERGTGLHRYVFLAYKQPRDYKFTKTPLLYKGMRGRENFSTANFTSKYNLSNPVAGNFFRSKYEDSDY